jgi:hypothetical protein
MINPRPLDDISFSCRPLDALNPMKVKNLSRVTLVTSFAHGPEASLHELPPQSSQEMQKKLLTPSTVVGFESDMKNCHSTIQLRARDAYALAIPRVDVEIYNRFGGATTPLNQFYCRLKAAGSIIRLSPL